MWSAHSTVLRLAVALRHAPPADRSSAGPTASTPRAFSMSVSHISPGVTKMSDRSAVWSSTAVLVDDRHLDELERDVVRAEVRRTADLECAVALEIQRIVEFRAHPDHLPGWATIVSDAHRTCERAASFPRAHDIALGLVDAECGRDRGLPRPRGTRLPRRRERGRPSHPPAGSDGRSPWRSRPRPGRARARGRSDLARRAPGRAPGARPPAARRRHPSQVPRSGAPACPPPRHVPPCSTTWAR